MKPQHLMNALTDIDYDMVEAAERTGRSAGRPWIKWAAAAACLVLLLGAGLMFLPKLLRSAPGDGESTAPADMAELSSAAPSSSADSRVGGRYKDGWSLLGGEYAIVWPWELQTAMEQYSSVRFDGVLYQTRGREIGPALLGEKLGVCEGVGWDEYTEQEYSRSFDVYAIRGVDSALLIAVELDGTCAVYLFADRQFPAALGDLLDACSLPETLPLERFCTQEGYQTTGWYLTRAGSGIWQVLSDCRDAPCRVEDSWMDGDHDRITFAITSEALGVYTQALSVTEDGYLVTNLMEYRYVFDIGPEAAGRILRLAKENCTETQMKPYYETVAGTLTEIGDGYVLIDDSILCRDEAEGIVYRVLTDDLRIRRCLEFPGDIQVGDLVVAEYEGVLDPENGNTVTGAFSLREATLIDGGAAVQE